jgi:hypothetical protein
MTDDEFRARLPAEMLARLDAGEMRAEDLPILKPLLREAMARPWSTLWYRNPSGRHRWHVSASHVIPGLGAWAACGTLVRLEPPGHLQPPPDAVVCQRCQKTRVAAELISTMGLSRRRKDRHG